MTGDRCGRVCVLFVAMVLFLPIGCGPGTSPTTSPGKPPEQWDDAVQVVSGTALVLVPLGPDGKADGKAAEALGRDLFGKLAEDPESQKLLRRLYGLPVEVVVLDGGASFDADAVEKARPEKGPAVLLSVHVEQPGQERRYEGDQAKARGYDRSYFWTFSLGRVTRQRKDDPDRPRSVAEALARQPNDRELLYLAANDYLLRHAPGWQLLFQGTGISPHAITKPARDATELRARVDRRIDEHVGRDQGKE
jgi:hypothetical protein